MSSLEIKLKPKEVEYLYKLLKIQLFETEQYKSSSQWKVLLMMNLGDIVDRNKQKQRGKYEKDWNDIVKLRSSGL